MKKQTLASLLCVLLTSTFAHEYLHQKHFQSQNSVGSHNSKYLSHLAQNRNGSNSGEVCAWQCPGGADPTAKEDIQMVVNSTTNIVALLNVTIVSVHIVMDLNNRLLMVGNGTTGNIIIFDLDGQYGVHVIDKKSPLFWVSANMTFEAYINGLPSLKPVLEEAIKVGESKFPTATPEKFSLQLCGLRVMPNFGGVVGRDVKPDLSNSIIVLINVARRFSMVLKGPLAGLLKDLTATNFMLNIGLKPIIERLEGLAYDLNEIEEGLDTLIKHHIKIDLKKILQAESGIESLTYLLNSHMDVVTAIGGYGSLERSFDVIVHLSGASMPGYSAYVRVIGLVIGAAQGNVSEGVLIDALVKYSISTIGREKLYEQFNTSLKSLLKALNKINTGGKIDSTVNDFKKLINGTLVIRGVNIAEIAKLIAQNGNNVPIDSVVGILVAIKGVVNVSESIPILILYILNHLNTQIGITLITNLFPSVKIDENIMFNSGDGNILEALWKKENYSDLVATKFDIDKILEKLPVIGDIWGIISGSLNTQSKESIKLSVVIKSNGATSIAKQILGVVGAALHYDLKADVNVGVGRHGHHVERKHENHRIEHLKHGIKEKIHHLKQ